MSILVPVDFSAISERVCDVAAEVAKAREVKVWLIHVAEPEPEFVGYDPGPDVVRHQVATELRQEHRKLKALADRISAKSVDVTPLLIQGSTVDTILEQVEHHGADLIVMATHGRGLMYQMLVGSVSEGVLHRTKVPILLVPARES